MRRSTILVPFLLAACSEPAGLSLSSGGGAGLDDAGGGAGTRRASGDAKADDAAEPAGPEAIATAGAASVELPAAALSAGKLLATFGAGSGEGQLGFFEPGPGDDTGDAGDDEGPAAIGVDGEGRVYLLDAVNDRVLRLDAATGAVTGTFPTEQGLVPLDLGVAADGSFAVVYANGGAQELVLTSPQGTRVAVAALDDALTPVTQLFVEPGRVVIEHDELRCYPVVQGGRAVPVAEQRAGELPGAPTGAGSANGALVGDHTAIVRLFDPEGFLLREATIQGDARILSMPVLRPIADGGLVVVLLREAGEGATYHAARFSPELEVEATASFAPALSRGLSRDLAVAPDGTLYQLLLDDAGASVAVHLDR